MHFHGGIGTDGYLDFSVNVPVRPLAPAAREYLLDAMERIDRYPGIDGGDLAERMTDRLGVDTVVGGGATQLLYAAGRCFRGRRAMIVQPAFTEYESAFQEAVLHHYNLLEDCEGFREEDAADRIAEAVALCGADLIVLCNPNNPMGIYLPTMTALLLDRTKADLVVDESFVDFVDEVDLGAHFSRTWNLIRRHSNRLLVIRSMTKAFSVAGIRLGYACGGPERMRKLREEMEPWAVNSFAAAFLRYVLDHELLERTDVCHYRKERERVTQALRTLGLTILPDVPGDEMSSAVNFILFRAYPGLNRDLNARGINIRTCGDFRYLDDGVYRTTIRSPEENDRLIRAIGDCLNGCGRWRS